MRCSIQENGFARLLIYEFEPKNQNQYENSHLYSTIYENNETHVTMMMVLDYVKAKLGASNLQEIMTGKRATSVS